jgi:hypothetical protein
MLSATQLAQKIQEVPVIELSYENTTSHNKVCDSYQVILAIPRSKKYVAWFTFFEEQDICILLELNREKQIVSYRQINVLFDTQEPHLALGTLLYGSMIHEIENTIQCSFFVIEDILVYRGVSVRKLTFGDRLGILYHILHEPTILPCDENVKGDKEFEVLFKPTKNPIRVRGLDSSWSVTDKEINPSPEGADLNLLRFKLPVMQSCKQTAFSIWSEKTFYKIHHLQYRSLTKIIPYLNQPYTTNPQIGLWNQPLEIKQDTTKTFASYTSSFLPKNPVTKTPRQIEPVGKQCTQFWVTADLQSDIYHLVDPKSIYKTDFAYIPNYKTSVFMNSLFRNIKENINIDAIEDSDDEEDFYDTRYDKYVDLKKQLLMECIYHKKFKRWVPFRNITNTNINTKINTILHQNEFRNGYSK